MIYRAFSEINRYNHPYQIISRAVKYQSFVINIIILLGALYLISINLFLILISKLVSLTLELVRPLNMFIRQLTGNLKISSDSRIRSIIAKSPKYWCPVQKDFHFQNCREKIAGSLNEFCNRWCKREHVECDAFKEWKLNIFIL